jgi:hypothetical protein
LAISLREEVWVNLHHEKFWLFWRGITVGILEYWVKKIFDKIEMKHLNPG